MATIMAPSRLILALLFSIAASQSQFLNQKRKVISVTREENNLDDSITEIFNLCKCVIFYTCDEDNFIIPQDQLKTTRVPFNQPMRNIFRIRCSNEYYYCCKNRTEVRMAPRIRNVAASAVQRCGQSKSTGSSRLIDEFPWIVAIYYKKSDNEFSFKCAGSLIHPSVVMTGQECIKSLSENDLRIVNGREMLGQKVKFSLISKIIKHEADYSGGPYDIALLVLQAPLSGTTTVCLSTPSQNFNGIRCVSVGWSGMTQSGSHKLKKTTLPIIDPQRCEYLLRNASPGPDFQLHRSYLCAEDRDTCRDDAGGPLMCQEYGGQYIQVGIVPTGSKCRREDVPSLYTNVGYLGNWISQKIVAENL